MSDRNSRLGDVSAQRLHRELLGRRPGWVYLHCGVCAREHAFRALHVIGEGTGRTVVTAIPKITMGEEDFAMSPDELLAMATTWTRQHGELHQFVRDAPRVSVDALRADIAERMPYLTDRQVEVELEDQMGRRRNDRSTDRLAWTDVEMTDGRSRLRCWDCGVTSTFSRPLLARKIDEAVERGKALYVSPGRLSVRYLLVGIAV
jgi:hypothetical protein